MSNLIFPTLYESLFLAPMCILAVFACLPITIKVLRKNEEPSNTLTAWLGVLGIILAAIETVWQGHHTNPSTFSGALIFDRLAVFANLGVLAISAFTILLSISGVNTRGQSYAEHVFLVLMSCVGMMTLTSAGDLIVAFVGLEIMSIALYVLIGLGHEQLLSKEAAFKYFILGSFASAIFLYGIALVFGTTGTTEIHVLAAHSVILATTSRIFVIGLIMLLVGIGFKVSLFPFHAWTPDVYQGAPTSVSGFMATGVKMVMFTLLLRLACLHLFMSDEKIIHVLQVIAILTMTVGNITAIVQENIKRMLAYSSIAHAGYILVGVIAAMTSKGPDAASAALFYLLSYSVMNVGAFAIVSIFEKEERGNLSVSDYAGLGYKYPMLGVAMTVFMLSLAGIPPMAGFLGKFYIFAAAIKEGYIGLAIAGVINSLLSVYYYLRLLVYMYMKEETFDVRASQTITGRSVIAINVALTLVMGVVSTLFYNPAFKSILEILGKN